MVSSLSGLMTTMRYSHSLLGRSNRAQQSLSLLHCKVAAEPPNITRLVPWSGLVSSATERQDFRHTQPSVDMIRFSLQNCLIQRYVKSQSDLMLPVRHAGIQCVILLQLEVWKQNRRNLTVEQLIATDQNYICFSSR